jgi:lipopolysaccharide biosynthesis regulator YciM
MGYRGAQQNRQQKSDRLSRDYVTGVNFLLSDQQDKAVDLFLEMLKEEGTTFEAHLTLGNLFRSRGEVDRAIRIHQSLLESAALSFEQRLLIIQQLGRDYMAAGLFDRAEAMFHQLVGENEFRLSALQQLLIIYQMVHDWPQAIDTAEKLVKLGKTEQLADIAHFYCELALQVILTDDLDKALLFIKKAANADDHSARVSMMYGRVFMAKGEYQSAIMHLEQVLKQDKALMSDVLPMLKICYQHLQLPDAWRRFVRRCVDEKSGVCADLMWADILAQESGRDAAHSYIDQQLRRQPTLRGFYRLMDYHLLEAEEGRAKESLLLLRHMVGEQIKTKPHYRCNHCGFTSHSLYWHCPSCRAWSTIKPIYGLDGQ